MPAPGPLATAFDVIRKTTPLGWLTAAGAGTAAYYGAGQVFPRMYTPRGERPLTFGQEAVLQMAGGLPGLTTRSPIQSFVQTAQAVTSVPITNVATTTLATSMGIAGGFAGGKLAMGLLSSVKTASKFARVGGPISGAVLGAGAGVYMGTKTGIDLGRRFYGTLSTSIRESLGIRAGRPYKARMKAGTGVRNWTTPSIGRRMKPNHASADGALVLAMHRTRGKSLL